MVRRYVGFLRGRVSQSSGGFVEFDDYVMWIKELEENISSSSHKNATFSRYADTIHSPKNPEPVNILLDLAEVEDIFITSGAEGIPERRNVDIENVCLDINNRTFELIANGKTCKCSIEYNSEYGTYKIISNDLRNLYKSKDKKFWRGDLVSWLNHYQSFRVLPKSENSIYSAGQFYKPIYKIGKDFDEKEFAVGKLMICDSLFSKINSEKGDKIINNKWDHNSLFELIDSLGNGTNIDKYFASPDIVICDDMGTEIADFIIASKYPSSIIAVHAKASKVGNKYGASAISDVCTQATKNIEYISMYGNIPGSRASKWSGQWNNKGYSTKRIRKGSPDGKTILEELKDICKNPISDREIWLFLGNLLSKRELIKEMQKESPAPPAIQTTYLIHSTMTSAQSIGAKLRVFCSP